MTEDKKLNSEQLEAVRYGEGPLLIIAGAGTGKTTVITERIKWLIASEKTRPAEILALTFTDKAAREMEERVDVALPYGYIDMWISTFHSFCDRVLRQEALQIGLDPGYKLMSQSETTQFLVKNLFKFRLKYFRPLGNPTKFIGGMLQHFSRLKDEDVKPEEYLKYVQKLQNSKTPKLKEEVEKTAELARAYRTYEELKVKEGVMDFGDLIANTLRLFRIRKNVLRQYRRQFKYFLVDEYQDTNIAQNELVILLAGKKANLTVVADDDQSIYKWRGAAVSNVIQFRKHFPKVRVVTLTKNYRSTQTILDQAHQLIQHNNPDRLEVKEKIDKKLRAVRRIEEEPIKFIRADRVENEAEAVAKEIKKLTEKTPEVGGGLTKQTSGVSPGNRRLKSANTNTYQFKDIAILVRANNHADPFVRALQRAGIPYQFLGPGQLFRQAEVKDLIAYLKALYDFTDNVALYRVLSMDIFDLSARDLAFLNSTARRFNLSLFEICESIIKETKKETRGRDLLNRETIVSSRRRISEKTQEKIGWFVKMVHRHLKLLAKETAGQILYYFLEDTGLLKKLAEYKTVTEEKRGQNISKFFDRLKTYEVDHEDASVQAVVDWLTLSMNLGESPLASDLDWTEENRVNLLTIHSSKGLEFSVVFLVNLVAARFPSRERQEQVPIPEKLIKEILPVGDYHEQEERRLFYVGMTRAGDRLFLTAANYYGEGKREKKISPFVIEALGEKRASQPASQPASQLSFFDWGRTEEVAQLPSCPAAQLPISFLSYSQIDTFNTCPRRYRFKYIQRIPVLPSHAASFGSSMHKTLQSFYQEIKDGRSLTKKDLLELLELNWVPEGYTSRAHEERRKKEGRRMLGDFYQQFDAKVTPKDLEQPFVIRVSPRLKVGGKIDRVDEKDGQLEIIDYKTGRVMEQKDVDKSLQMTVYALAANDPGIYGQKPEDVVLTFYFLDTGEKKSTKRTGKQLNQAKKELLEKAKEIEKSDFEPRPGIWCDFCDYRLLCEAWS